MFRLLAETLTSFDSKFRRARPVMERYVQEALSAAPEEPLPALPERFGTFESCDVRRLPDGMVLRCLDCGQAIDLTYSNRPLPEWPPDMAHKSPDEPVARCQHLAGNWYRLHRA